MKKAVAILLLVVLLGASGLAYADSCSCTYEGVRTCSTRIECPGKEKAVCTCTATGCNSSCSSAGTNQMTQSFSLVQTSDSFLDGLAGHLERVTGWTFVTRTPLGVPLSLEQRSGTYVDMSFEELLEAIADDYGLCVEPHEKSRIAVFKTRGSCR